MSEYVDRYEKFNSKTIPLIDLPVLNTDKYIVYKLGRTRLDKVSNEYYSNPYHGWLIMLANPQYGGIEFNIPNNTIIRIPFPFTSAINNYNLLVDKYIYLNE